MREIEGPCMWDEHIGYRGENIDYFRLFTDIYRPFNRDIKRRMRRSVYHQSN